MSGKSDFQARSSEEGREAQAIAEKVLKGCGFKIQSRNSRLAHVDVLINFIARDATGMIWYFDTAGSFSSARAGLLRTDTMWKTLGRANVLSAKGIAPLIFLTTNLPKRGSVGDHALRLARSSFFDAVEMLPSPCKARLAQYATGKRRDKPLPGFFTPQEIYGTTISLETSLGTAIRVPLSATGEEVSPGNFTVRRLPHHFAVYLPSKDRNGRVIPATRRKAVSEKIQNLLHAVGGGTTQQVARGSWLDPLSGVVYENVDVLTTYSETPFPDETRDAIVTLIQSELDQAATALIVDDAMYQFYR